MRLQLLDDAGRCALDYYKNTALFFLIPSAIVALAVLVQPSTPAPDEDVRATAQELAELIELEVPIPLASDVGAGFAETAEPLRVRRILKRLDDGESPAWATTLMGREAALELSGSIAVFVQAYRHVAQCLDALEDGPQPSAQLTRHILLQAQKRILEGRILRPEAASKLTVGNALKLVEQRGLIVREGDELSLAEGSNDARQKWVEELDGFLEPLR